MIGAVLQKLGARVPMIAAGAGAGLFAARLLGEVLPDGIAAAIAMYAAGYVTGRLSQANGPRGKRERIHVSEQ